MKHPEAKILFDYFENSLPSELEARVRDHLETCDHCTQITFELAQIETGVREMPAPVVSAHAEKRLMLAAHALLEERRLELKKREESLISFIAEWKEKVMVELKVPALQASSLSLVAALIIAIEMGQVEEHLHQPIDNNVTEITSGEK